MAEIITKDRKEYNIWDKINGVWNRLNFLTNAKSVDADDGKDLQTKVGAINGITSDLTGEAEDIAASIKCVNQLNSSLTSLVPIYNPEDDYFYVNGNKWKWAGLKFNGVIYSDGTFAIGYSIDENSQVFSSGWITDGGWIDDGYAIKATAPTENLHAICSAISGKIDFTKYSYLNLILNGTTYSIDVSGIYTFGYIGLVITSSFLRIYVLKTQKPETFDLAHYTTKECSMQSGYNYITKIWLE